jgi:hypothetical protein
VIVGTPEPQRPQHRLEPLAAATGTAGFLPTRAHAACCRTVGEVGIEPAFDRARGELKRALPHHDLECPEIEAGDRSRTYEGLDLAGELLVERCLEPLFSAASAAATRSSSASAQVSLACQ